MPLDQFHAPAELWARYCARRGLDEASAPKAEALCYDDGSGRAPRYYQVNAINRTVEAVAKGQQRVLLVMATATGKTYTAFQIIWRLWKSRQAKRILFLADRNILVDQTKNNMLFRPCMIEPDFLQLTLPDPSAVARQLAMHKGIGAKHVNVAGMRAAWVPLPPLAEQRRIVAKVTELLALCDQVKARIAAARAKHAQLAEALVAQAVAAA